jgi:hypothetical protein
MSKTSRWAPGAVRYSNERKVDSVRYVLKVIKGRKTWRLEEKEVSEHAFVNQRLHSGSTAFHRGARVRRVAV